MKALLKSWFDRTEHHFAPAARAGAFYPLFEAIKSFAFGDMSLAERGAKIRDVIDTKRIMILVDIALMPAVVFGIYNAGFQAHLLAGETPALSASFISGLWIFLPIFLVTALVGGFWEVFFAIIRKHEVNEGFFVTMLLFPLTLPPTIPLWQVALGITFGVVIGKEIFGGSGRNFLNPALAGRAFLFFGYPASFSGGVYTSFLALKDHTVQAVSSATPLMLLSAHPASMHAGILADAKISLSQLFWGLYPGSLGETAIWAILIGAVILIVTGVASWQIMASCLVGGILTSLLFITNGGVTDTPAIIQLILVQLCAGGFAFGLVFMTTDPVSGPMLNASKWGYGFLIGFIAIMIRFMNPAYPEGMMLAILLLNAFAPLIDQVVLQFKIRKRIPNDA